MRSVSSLWTLPIWSFQRVRRTVPVSSPTVASTSFLASPNFDVISLSSLRLTTLTKTFTCLEEGVKSLTFVIDLSSMFSLLPTQDARVAKAGKTVSSRIQTLWADPRLRVPRIKTLGSGGAQYVRRRSVSASREVFRCQHHLFTATPPSYEGSCSSTPSDAKSRTSA